MRKSVFMVVSVLFLFTVFIPQVQGQTVFKMAFVAPPPVWGPVADKYAQIVAQKTNNQFEIKSLRRRTARHPPSEFCRDQDRPDRHDAQ